MRHGSHFQPQNEVLGDTFRFFTWMWLPDDEDDHLPKKKKTLFFKKRGRESNKFCKPDHFSNYHFFVLKQSKVLMYVAYFYNLDWCIDNSLFNEIN